MNKKVEKRVQEIASLYGLASSKDQAIEMGKDKFLQVEYASCYGGYRLVMVNVQGGGYSGAFGKSSCCPRMKLSHFVAYLDGLEYGFHYANRNKAKQIIKDSQNNEDDDFWEKRKKAEEYGTMNTFH